MNLLAPRFYLFARQLSAQQAGTARQADEWAEAAVIVARVEEC